MKTIKFSHVGPQTDARHTAALKFKEAVEKGTNGSIKVDVFPAAQLGGDRDVIEGVRLGTIEMTVSGAGLFAPSEPKMGITALPFLFENFEQAWAFCDSKLNAEVSALLLKIDIRVLAWWENGFRCLTNSVRPINSPDDVKGLKIRTPENPMILATMKALGASPSPLPWAEVYMALQQKAFDGQENPIPVIYVNKLYEVQKYMSITNHIYEPMALVISEKFWKTLTSSEQKVVAKAAIEAQDYNRQLIKAQTEDMLVKLKEAGMIIVTPDLKPFQQATAKVPQDFVSQFGEDLIRKAYDFGK
ncbi:MAG: TRAP transporter substrate-binding protein [Spirochaetales bacterium]|nr:TRAP transporter substrate-binding protein [Spirochaetales bacterium]